MNQKLTKEEVKKLIDRIGPSLGCGDCTYAPIFPKGREDVCAIRRMAENGSTYGFDTIYLVWKDASGKLQYKDICNSRATKDYIHITDVVSNDDQSVTVRFSSGGSYSGHPWEASATKKIG